MVVKKYGLILIFSIILSITYTQVFAQSKIDSLINTYNLKRADKAFNNMAYVKAIDIYVQLIDKNFTNEDVYRNIATAYLKTGETEKSAEYYGLLVNKSQYNATDIYNYAQALKYNGNYSEADRWMKKFAELDAADSRAKRQANTSERVKNIKSVVRYEIEDLPFNTKYADFGPALMGNKLYFASERRVDAVVNYEYAWKDSPYLDIYELNLDGTVSNPTFLKDKVNSKYHDGPICFSEDGSEMFFTRNNSIFRIISKKGKENVDNLKIYYSKKVNGEYKTSVELPFNSDDYSCGHPSLSSDGKVLYFTSDMPGGFGGADIYTVERTDSGWSAPKNLGPEINTEGNEMFPFIHESGVLYFSSNGQAGMGGLDIFKAKLKNGKYVIENMGYPMNSSSDDFSLIIDKDQKAGYFASNREGGKGDDDIYKFLALKVNLNLQGKVLDQDTKQRIEQASIVLKNSKGDAQRLITSSSEFDFKTEIEPNDQYIITVNKDEYNSYQASIIPSQLDQNENTISYNVLLKKAPFWGIFGKIYYKETLEEISDVSIQVANLSTQDTSEYFSDVKGDFRIKLAKDNEYSLFFTKEGIFSKRANYSTMGIAPGWVNADKIVDLAFEKVELNKKIEIPNIYYDLGKWDIRQDAAVELDKVVGFLLDNPQIKIELGSHTDARGSSKSNQWLSQKRAQSAVDYIVSKGIDSNRITAKGYGETQIKNRCKDGVKCSEAEHQENRRTEIRITGIQK